MSYERTPEIGSPTVELNLSVTRLVDGIGYGEGTISHVARAGSEVPKTELAKIEDVITSPDILMPVSKYKGREDLLADDGCGDGRGVLTIIENGEIRKKSLNRAKVFGGGATMTLSAMIANKAMPFQNLQDAFTESMQQASSHGIDFGAHSDEHASDDKSGCGAIDNAPKILRNAVRMKSEIADTITALGIDTTGLDEVNDAFGSYVSGLDDAQYNGKSVLDGIVLQGKVIKQLKSSHNEMYIVLNTVPGYTVNQIAVRDASKESVQVFAVDVWRIQQIAEKMYTDTTSQHKALLGELVYTLATAATLTKGDLPVYSVSST